MHKLDKALVQDLLGLLDSTWPDARFNVRYDTVTMGKPMATAECASLPEHHHEWLLDWQFRLMLFKEGYVTNKLCQKGDTHDRPT